MMISQVKHDIYQEALDYARKEAKDIINDITEKATAEFKRRLRETLDSHIYSIVNNRLNDLNIESNIDFTNPEKSNVTIKYKGDYDDEEL